MEGERNWWPLRLDGLCLSTVELPYNADRMWPLFNPSIYQPPSPVKHMTPAEFASQLKDLSQKPDVDNVFEIISCLRGQESVRPTRMTLRRFFLHRFMILPAIAFAACIVTAVVHSMQSEPTGRPNAGKVLPELADMALASSSVVPWPLLCAILAVLLMALRASIRDKDPEILEMRSSAATCIARMALDPKYVHEPFSSIETTYLRRLLGGRGYEKRKALEVLLSPDEGAGEPDPDFTGGERPRS